LRVENLNTSFETPRGQVRAVSNVSFSLDRSKTLGIVGESGSGKTVLSRSIMGPLPSAGVSNSGRVIFEGRDLQTATASEMRTIWGARMSLIFQDPMTALNPCTRIGSQIAESLRLHLHLSAKEAKLQSIELLRQVGIPSPLERADAYPTQLSGGMRQRVVIAIAIACAPRLLLADEPTTGLDVTVQAQILDLIDELRSEREMAMILVSHDLGVVATRTDEIAVMYAGKIVEKAPTKRLFANMRMPYTEALLQSMPKIQNPSHTRLQTIPGNPPDLTKIADGCSFAPRCSYATEQCRTQTPPLRQNG
ncbi:MAG: ABC transporter ATP-binding protein, partial [Actinobacteria bacterium]|nr:ABC transporter ATP-binding protein [Actinomycetota bacterium]